MTREPFIAHSELTNEIYIVVGKEKYRVTEQAIKAVMAIKALEQQPCEDVISRAEAEAIFRNARSKLNPSDYKTADEFNARDLMLLNAEQLIHLLPSVKPQEPKWIPVSERLPEPQDIGDKDFSDWVLITINLGKDNGTHTGEAYYCFSEKRWYAKRFVMGEVIAWMPLPEPYKAGSEG